MLWLIVGLLSLITFLLFLLLLEANVLVRIINRLGRTGQQSEPPNSTTNLSN